MHSLAEELFLPSPAYALMMALGLAAAGIVYWLFPAEQAPDRKGFVLAPAALGIFLGAKLPVIASYGWDNLSAYAGKSLLGGLMGAYLAVRLAKWISGIRWVGGGDAYVLPVSIAVAFGRVGCLFNGCCRGANGFPAPVLEIFFHLTAFAVVMGWRRNRRHMGSWFPMYMLAYCVFRFFSEFIRVEPRILAGLTAYHWLSLLGMVLFTAELRCRRKRNMETVHEHAPVE